MSESLADSEEKGNLGDAETAGCLQVAKSPLRVSATGVETISLLSDYIRIEQLEVEMRVGVTEAERSQPQRLTISLSLWPRHPLVDLGDDLARTINYSELCDEVKAFSRTRNDKLIETVADALAAHLLKKFSIRQLTVEIRKFVRSDAKFVAVTINRSAAIG